MKQYQVTLTAATVNLATALGLTAVTDLPFREVVIQAKTAAAYLGDSDVTSTTYGHTLAADGVLQLGGYDSGPLRLSNLWATGNNCVLHILAIPF